MSLLLQQTNKQQQQRCIYLLFADEKKLVADRKQLWLFPVNGVALQRRKWSVVAAVEWRRWRGYDSDIQFCRQQTGLLDGGQRSAGGSSQQLSTAGHQASRGHYPQNMRPRGRRNCCWCWRWDDDSWMLQSHCWRDRKLHTCSSQVTPQIDLRQCSAQTAIVTKNIRVLPNV